MLDWFREIAEELSGIDSSAAKKERVVKREQKKSNRFIYSPGMKIVTIFLSILYIVLAISMIRALREQPGDTTIQIVKYVLMSILASVVSFSLIFGRKKGEIVAIIGTYIFVVGLFLSTTFM